MGIIIPTPQTSGVVDEDRMFAELYQKVGICLLMLLGVGMSAKAASSTIAEARGRRAPVGVCMPAEDLYRQGVDFEAAGQYVLAMDRYGQAASFNYPRAQYNGAVLLFEGKEGVLQDRNKAIELFTAAAMHGHTRAQFNLGYFYEKGKGVPQDKSLAKMWYGKAADAGFERAQSQLAAILEEDSKAAARAEQERVAEMTRLAAAEVYRMAELEQARMARATAEERARAAEERAAALERAGAARIESTRVTTETQRVVAEEIAQRTAAATRIQSLMREHTARRAPTAAPAEVVRNSSEATSTALPSLREVREGAEGLAESMQRLRARLGDDIMASPGKAEGDPGDVAAAPNPLKAGQLQGIALGDRVIEWVTARALRDGEILDDTTVHRIRMAALGAHHRTWESIEPELSKYTLMGMEKNLERIFRSADGASVGDRGYSTIEHASAAAAPAPILATDPDPSPTASLFPSAVNPGRRTSPLSMDPRETE